MRKSILTLTFFLQLFSSPVLIFGRPQINENINLHNIQGYSSDAHIKQSSAKGLYATVANIDTSRQKEISNYPELRQMDKSEYNELLAKILDQKQAFYDSSLNTLQLWAAIVTFIIALLTLGFVIMAFIGFGEIKDIQTDIEGKLEVKIKKITTDKYEADIDDFNKRISDLEAQTPEEKAPKEPIEKEPKIIENPWG